VPGCLSRALTPQSTDGNRDDLETRGLQGQVRIGAVRLLGDRRGGLQQPWQFVLAGPAIDGVSGAIPPSAFPRLDL